MAAPSFLTKMLGSAKARELYLTSPVLTAREALGLGMVTRVVADAEIDAAAHELALSLARGPSVTLGYIKTNINNAETLSLEACFDAEAMHHSRCGETAAGSRGAASHTASMAGWNAAYDAVFAHYGFIVSNDLDETMTMAAALTTSPLPDGDRVAVLTVSGGAGIWAADAVSAQALDVPELSGPLQATIRALIPSYGSARNPVDITAQAVHSGGLQATLDLLERSDEVDAILVVLSLSSATRIPFKLAELKPVLDRQRKPILFYSYTLPSDFARSSLAAAGVVALSGLTDAAIALRAMLQRARFRLAPFPDVDNAALPDLSSYPAGAPLSEFDSKAVLRAAGISIPDEQLVSSAVALDAALARAPFPLAMKIQSRDIPHKSEVGGVRIGVGTADAARDAYAALLRNAHIQRPDAAIQGVLLSPMAKPGVEIIVGTLQDATFGPMVMVGLGGVTAELFRDVVYRPAPIGAEAAEAMLRELKTAPLLHGFRGAAPADVAALALLIAQISQLAAGARDEIAEIELNPVLVHPQGHGVTIVDALVVRRP